MLVTVPALRHGCRLGSAQPKFPDVPHFPLCWVRACPCEKPYWHAGGVSEPWHHLTLTWYSQITFQTDGRDCAWGVGCSGVGWCVTAWSHVQRGQCGWPWPRRPPVCGTDRPQSCRSRVGGSIPIVTFLTRLGECPGAGEAVKAVRGCPGPCRRPSPGHLRPGSTPGRRRSVCSQSGCSHARAPETPALLGR